MTLSSAEIKRQILMSAGTSEIKRRMDANPPGITDGEYIELGNALEVTIRSAGWPAIEAWMIRHMNLVGFVLEDGEGNKDQKGIAKAYIWLMQWIQLSIQKRDEILEKERVKHEAKNVPKDEGK